MHLPGQLPSRHDTQRMISWLELLAGFILRGHGWAEIDMRVATTKLLAVPSRSVLYRKLQRN